MTKLRYLIAIVSLGIAAALIPSALSAQGNGYVDDINTFDRSEVARSYQDAIVAGSLIDHRWNGADGQCRAGEASAEYSAATIGAVNWFRRMSGLEPVTEDATASRAAQQAALMMHAGNSLSHYPAQSWPCYTAQGAESAGRSNLTLGVAGAQGVIGQIEDPGAGNEVLGHRRWLLFPELASIGVGNTSRASAIEVIGDFVAPQSESAWVTWPPPGFVPGDVVFDRWSFSYAAGEADFSRATVSVTENGRNVPVTVYPAVAGFGDPTLGFEVHGINPRSRTDVQYRVEISGVIINGSARSHSYNFTSFDPSTTSTAPATSHTCQGWAATLVGTTGNDTLVGTKGRDVIVGLGGDDRIEGLGGNDIICGGSGDDEIYGGWGRDTIAGGNGRDQLFGNHGVDTINGGAGLDRLAGGNGDDVLIGGLHHDELIGNAGNDTCWGNSPGQSQASIDERACERGR